jgi:hypothetical protein
LGCNATQFDCFSDGTMCLDFSHVCDGHNDCGNLQDEPKDKCGLDECSVDNGSCEQKCVDHKVGHECQCKIGYRKNEHDGGKTCQGERRWRVKLVITRCDFVASRIWSRKAESSPVCPKCLNFWLFINIYSPFSDCRLFWNI